MGLPLQASSLAGFKQDKPVVEAIQDRDCVASIHDDVVTCIGFSHYWPFDQWVRLIRGQWHGTLMFYLSLTWKFVDKKSSVIYLRPSAIGHNFSREESAQTSWINMYEAIRRLCRVVSCHLMVMLCYVMFLTPCIETMCWFRGRNRHKTMQSKHLIQIECSNIMLRGKAILQTSFSHRKIIEIRKPSRCIRSVLQMFGQVGGNPQTCAATRRNVHDETLYNDKTMP